MTKRYYTVVYEISEGGAFDSLTQAIAAVKERTAVKPIDGVRISACGEGDYATERDAYYKELTMSGTEPMDVVAGYIRDEHPDGVTAEQAAHLAAEVCPG